MTPPSDLGFPSSYLEPLKTAIGNAWPRPRVRRIMEDLDTVQKRMADLQMRIGGLGRKDKTMRQEKFLELQQEYKLAEVELSRLMAQFSKMPVTKEQFKRPDALLSECCDAYVRETAEDDRYHDECVDCGHYCQTFTRLEREKWAEEYQEVLKDRQKEAAQQMEDVETIKKTMEAAAAAQKPKPLSSGFLIT